MSVVEYDVPLEAYVGAWTRLVADVIAVLAA
jgi:hypothetical protein